MKCMNKSRVISPRRGIRYPETRILWHGYLHNRYIFQPWPIIANFLASLPTGWVGLDSGTGNGKYLPLPADRPGCLLTIGMDRSQNLLNAARTAGDTDVIREVVRGDVLDNPWRRGVFVRNKFPFVEGSFKCSLRITVSQLQRSITWRNMSVESRPCRWEELLRRMIY